MNFVSVYRPNVSVCSVEISSPNMFFIATVLFIQRLRKIIRHYIKNNDITRGHGPWPVTIWSQLAHEGNHHVKIELEGICYLFLIAKSETLWGHVEYHFIMITNRWPLYVCRVIFLISGLQKVLENYAHSTTYLKEFT